MFAGECQESRKYNTSQVHSHRDSGKKGEEGMKTQGQGGALLRRETFMDPESSLKTGQ